MYEENFITHLVDCWGKRMDRPGFSEALRQIVPPTPEEREQIIMACRSYYTWDVIHGMPIDVIRLYTKALREEKLDLRTLPAIFLLAPFDGEAHKIITRLKSP